MELALVGFGTAVSDLIAAIAATVIGGVLIVASTNPRWVESSQRALAITGGAFLAAGLFGLLYLG